MSKSELVAALLAQLSYEIDVVTLAAQAAREGATHEEAKPENDKDTRAIEAGYLAGAQAERVRDLRAAYIAIESMRTDGLAPDDAVRIGALVLLESDDGTRNVYLLAPHGGGMRATVSGTEVQVLTPKSPLGGAMLGKRAGDGVEVQSQKKLREYEIVQVQ